MESQFAKFNARQSYPLYGITYYAFMLLYDAQGYLVEAFKERMAYLRKPDDEKRGKGKATSIPSKPAPPSTPVVLEPPGEDKASHEKHLKCLKWEC